VYVERYGTRTLWNGMKALLDNYIQNNYKEVNRYANYFLHRLKSKLDADTVINNAYLRTLQYKGIIVEQYEAKALLFESIKAEVLWNSESKKEIINSVESDYIPEVEDTDLAEKIIQELRYNEQKNIVEIYRSQINDRVKLYFFQAYYDKGICTTRKIAEHFNISTASAHLLIVEMKEDIRRFENISKLNAL
jgi:hypothetical protein